MYHMLPYAYRTQSNYSRNKHGEFQNLVEIYVNKILQDTEVVDAESPNGRKLFNSIDTFFSYGLLTGDGAYWRFIKNFLPRTEQKMLIAECGNANDRFLSVGWLKTSFNKGTLHFMLLALNNQSNKIYLTRYYHVNACIRNSGLLEAITGYIEKLQPIQFAFYSRRQLRAEPVPAAVINPNLVQTSSRAAARQRKLTEKEASSDAVPNVIPTEIPVILTQAIDQDVLLEELVRNRHNRLNTDVYDAQNTTVEEISGNPFTEVTEKEKLEDVMTKKMSYANMESMDPAGIDEILASVEPQEEDVFEYNLADGEFQISQGDVLHLAINVFEKSTEKIIETFQVIQNFHSDARQLHYFVMTCYNLYVFKYEVQGQLMHSEKLRGHASGGTFHPVIRMPHDRIKSIKISIDNLSFMLEANDLGFAHYVDNREHDDQSVFSYSAAMGGLESGAHMINAMINVVEHSSCNLSTTAEIDDHIGYMCMLQPNIEKQLGRTIDIRYASMAFWYEQSSDERDYATTSMSGYLYKTNVSNWIKSSHDPEHKYCVMSGSDFHVFADSTCEKEIFVIHLSLSNLTLSGKSTFQLKCDHGNYAFECVAQDEFTKWINALTMVTEKRNSEKFIAPCLVIFTESTIALVQEGEKFWNDGFLRLLNEIDADKLKRSIVVVKSENNSHQFAQLAPALCLVSNDDHVNYFFIRFEKELRRLATAVQHVFGVQTEVLDTEILKDPLGKTIHNTCTSVRGCWLN